MLAPPLASDHRASEPGGPPRQPTPPTAESVSMRKPGNLKQRLESKINRGQCSAFFCQINCSGNCASIQRRLTASASRTSKHHQMRTVDQYRACQQPQRPRKEMAGPKCPASRSEPLNHHTRPAPEWADTSPNRRNRRRSSRRVSAATWPGSARTHRSTGMHRSAWIRAWYARTRGTSISIRG